jgi:hypothetical protein
MSTILHLIFIVETIPELFEQFFMISGARSSDNKEWPACDSAATDKTSSEPICDRKLTSLDKIVS